MSLSIVHLYVYTHNSRAWRCPLSQVESFRSVAAHQPVMPGLQASISSRALPYSYVSSKVTGLGPMTLIPFVKTKKQDYLQKCSD